MIQGRPARPDARSQPHDIIASNVRALESSESFLLFLDGPAALSGHAASARGEVCDRSSRSWLAPRRATDITYSAAVDPMRRGRATGRPCSATASRLTRAPGRDRVKFWSSTTRHHVTWSSKAHRYCSQCGFPLVERSSAGSAPAAVRRIARGRLRRSLAPGDSFARPETESVMMRQAPLNRLFEPTQGPGFTDRAGRRNARAALEHANGSSAWPCRPRRSSIWPTRSAAPDGTRPTRNVDDVCPGQLRALPPQDLQRQLEHRRQGPGVLAVRSDPNDPRWSASGTLVAYRDNAAVLQGGRYGAGRPPRGPAGRPRLYCATDRTDHVVFKVETAQSSDCDFPVPGCRHRFRRGDPDEAATGRGARAKAGLCGFSVSNLRLPDMQAPWSPIRTRRDPTRPVPRTITDFRRALPALAPSCWKDRSAQPLQQRIRAAQSAGVLSLLPAKRAGRAARLSQADHDCRRSWPHRRRPGREACVARRRRCWCSWVGRPAHRTGGWRGFEHRAAGPTRRILISTRCSEAMRKCSVARRNDRRLRRPGSEQSDPVDP